VRLLSDVGVGGRSEMNQNNLTDTGMKPCFTQSVMSQDETTGDYRPVRGQTKGRLLNLIRATERLVMGPLPGPELVIEPATTIVVIMCHYVNQRDGLGLKYPSL